MRRSESRFARRAYVRMVFALVASLVAFGCSGAGAGCSGMAPIPSGRYTGPKSDNAVNVRVTGAGLSYMNSNWPSLVEAFAPGGHLDFEIPCSKNEVRFLGDVYLADQGNGSGAGRNDGACTALDLPAKVATTITSFKLVPRAPDTLSVELGLQMNTGKIYATNPHSLCDVRCSLAYDNGTVGNTISTTVRFNVDPKWDNLLAFSVDDITGDHVCGAFGAPAQPNCLDPEAISLEKERGPCGFVCKPAEWAPVKSLVLKLASPFIRSAIKSAAQRASCEPCSMVRPDCPQLPGATSACVSVKDGLACTSDNCFCKDTATNTCVPRLLGAEGRVSVAPNAPSSDVPSNANVDLSVALGSTFLVDQGLTIGTRVGLQAAALAGCVTAQSAPSIVTVPAPNFDGEATPGSNYHVGVSLSASFLNVAFHQAQQAGALCTELATSTYGLINTGLFKTFLPSLGRLATRDGKDAPMMIALRPGRAPLVTVGLGTYDPVTKRPLKPLINLSLPELSIDLYAMLDDRYARLFTITLDLTMPMSLIFEGCDKATPALGDLKMLVSNVKTSNSELLAENPKVLEDLIPAVIGLAEPSLSGSLKSFAMPTLGSFKMKLTEAKGIGNITGSEAYHHLGLYATLLPSGAACAVSAPRTVASLQEAVMPKAQQMRLAGHPLPWPKAVVQVQALGKEGSPEFAYRIDDGLWSTFVPAVDGTFEVSHPRFLLQGAHTIWVRSRVAEDPHGISPAEPVSFVVDWEPPTVTVSAHEASDRLVVTAHDLVTADAALAFAYGVGHEPVGAFGPARDISLSAVEAKGGVTIQVKDELGNVAEVVYRAPTVALRPDNAPANTLDGVRAGCSSVGGLELLGAVAALGAIRRRRPRK